MKINELKQLRTKSVDDLANLIVDRKKKLASVQIDVHAGREKDLKLAKNIKLEIAKILTILKETQLIGKVGKKAK